VLLEVLEIYDQLTLIYMVVAKHSLICDNVHQKCLLLCRGASSGSVWLSWQTPLHCRYSSLKPIKYHTLSLQVS